MISFKGAHFEKDIILTCVRWYVAYPLSSRQLEELMHERGVAVDHATIHRGVLKDAPRLEAACPRRQRPVWTSWRLDDTSIRVRGHWHSLYRAGDKAGQTIDFLLTTQRDGSAARRFLTEAIRRHGAPENITVDGREAHAAAIKSDHATYGTAIVIRQGRYRNNVVEQDHRAVNRGVRPMRGFKSHETA